MNLILLILIIVFLIGGARYFLNKKKEQKENLLLINEEFLKRIKKILINNDVSLNQTNILVKNFSEKFKEKCNLEDLQIFISGEISHLLSKNISNLAKLQVQYANNNYGKNLPLVFVLLGNNGVGKTSFAMKLAAYFMRNQVSKEKILMTSLDFFRAGASQQLEKLAKEIDVTYLLPKNNSKGQCYDTYAYGKKNAYEIIILDTSGRIHTNDNLLDEIKDIMKTLGQVNAHVETIMVMDNNFGGISVNSFEAFNNITTISGVVLTKTDTQIGGGWLVKLIEQHTKLKLFGSVNGETSESFGDFDVDKYCKKIVNWEDLNNRKS